MIAAAREKYLKSEPEMFNGLASSTQQISIRNALSSSVQRNAPTEDLRFKITLLSHQRN